MSKVEQIQAQIQKLSQEEMEQVREWLEAFIEDQLEFTDEFKAKIEQSERERIAGQYSRIRRPEHDA